MLKRRISYLTAVTSRQSIRIQLEAILSRQMLWYLSAAFICAHLVYALLGVTFDTSMLVWAWHYLDPDLLRNRLAESLFYLHSQPPLYNLFLGLVLKCCAGNEGLVFHAVYLCLGLILYLSLFVLMRALLIARATAFVLSTLFMLSPSFVLYEHWLYYTFPLATILVVSTVVLHKFLQEGKSRYAWWFCALVAALCGMRSLFHLGYYVLTIGLLLVLLGHRRKQLIQAAIIPGLLVFGLYAKNWLLFGEFSSSSWLGMSMWKISGRQVPEPERRRLVAEGKLSPLALIESYSGVERYPPEYQQARGYETIPALRQVDKSTGAKNLNHLAVIRISNQHKADALYVLRHYPQAFLTGVAGAGFGYFKTSSDLEFLDGNRSRIGPINSLYNYLAYGKFPFDIRRIEAVPIKSDKPQFFYLFLLLGLPLLIAHGLSLSLKNAPDRSLSVDQRIVIGYICANIVYVAVISTLLEIGENNRIRFMTDPLYLILLGLLIQHPRWRPSFGTRTRTARERR